MVAAEIIASAGNQIVSRWPYPPYDAGDRGAEQQQQAEIAEGRFEVRLAPGAVEENPGGKEKRADDQGVDADRLLVPPEQRAARKGKRDAAPGRERRQREGEHGARIVAEGEGELDQREQEQVPGPARAEELVLRLEIGEIGADQQHPEQENVIEGERRRGDRAPRESRRDACDIPETEGRGERNAGADRHRAEMREVVLDQNAGAGGDQRHPGPEGNLELDAHGNQLAPRDAAEEAAWASVRMPRACRRPMESSSVRFIGPDGCGVLTLRTPSCSLVPPMETSPPRHPFAQVPRNQPSSPQPPAGRARSRGARCSAAA